MLNVSIQNAPSLTASAMVAQMSGSVKLSPASLSKVMFAYVEVNTTFLVEGSAVVSLLFAGISSLQV